MKLKDKVAVITGGASGIGKAAAILFAAEGAKVVIADLDEERGRSVAKEIRSQGGVADFIRTDVAKAEDAEAMIREAVERHGRIDILFNNAGRGDDVCAVTEMEERDWMATLDVNLKGVFLGSKYALREMTKAGSGVIVNTASVAGLEGTSFLASYGASKAGVIHFTKSLALEYGPMNIRVNCICPGATETPLFRKAIEKLPVEGIESFLTTQIPLRRIGRPEDVAQAALFLASDDAAYVTGAVLCVDGGLSSGKTGP